MERTPHTHTHTHTHTRLRVLHCYSFSFIACFNFIAVRYGCCATWLPVSLLPSIRPQRLNTITKAATTTTKKRHTNTPTTIHRKEKHHITTKQAKQRTNRRRTRVAREERRRVQLRSSLALRELLSHCLSTHCGASHCSDNPSTSFFFFYFGLVALSTYSNSHLGSASLIFVTPHPKKKKKRCSPDLLRGFLSSFFSLQLCSLCPSIEFLVLSVHHNGCRLLSRIEGKPQAAADVDLRAARQLPACRQCRALAGCLLLHVRQQRSPAPPLWRGKSDNGRGWRQGLLRNWLLGTPQPRRLRALQQGNAVAEKLATAWHVVPGARAGYLVRRWAGGERLDSDGRWPDRPGPAEVGCTVLRVRPRHTQRVGADALEAREREAA